MKKPSNQPVHKVYFNKDYGFGSAVPRQDSITSRFQRKASLNPRKGPLARDRQRKIEQDLLQMPYISPATDLNRLIRSCTADIMTGSLTKDKIHGGKINSQIRPTGQKKVSSCLSNNEEVASDKREKPKILSINHKISAVQMEELRLQKMTLQQEAKTLRHEVEKKDQEIVSLKQQIDEQNAKLSTHEQELVQLRNIEFTLNAKIREQSSIISFYKLQEFKDKQDGKTSVETGDDLDKISTDKNRNSIDVLAQPPFDHELAQELQKWRNEMQEKIKYQQIQIAMLKKNKYDFIKFKQEVESLRSQNKALTKQLKNCHEKMKEQDMKLCGFGHEISFELSREEGEIN